MLLRKSYAGRSARFQWFIERRNRHHARWNFQDDGTWDEGHLVVPTKGGQRSANDGGSKSDIFGHCTHILSCASRIGDLYWQRYQYTMDEAWLRDRAYPILKGAAEFYRHFPNFEKESDGKYHIHHLNNGESAWNSSDPPNEVRALHLIFPLAIRASEILGSDAELRSNWQEIADHLVALPDGEGGRRTRPYGSFVYNGPGAIEPLGPEPELKRRFLGFTRLGSFIDEPGIGGAQIFRNRLRLREGPGAIDAEHIGGLSFGIHSTMLSSEPETPGGNPVLRILHDWPKDWDAAFTLRARGGFVVSSLQKHGRIPFVEIHSEAGSVCRLRNPWADAPVTLFRHGRKAEDLAGETLQFATSTGETIIAVPQGWTPAVQRF
jgi:hypothetical protein